MPAVSKAQQQAAGIAHAVAKGEEPESKLRGASKQMFQSMKGGELKKFAKTKRKGLPKHVDEGAEVARALLAKATGKGRPYTETPRLASTHHSQNCQCGNCKMDRQHAHALGFDRLPYRAGYNPRMGRTGRYKKDFEGNYHPEAAPGTAKELLISERDDAPKLGLGKTGLKFARMTSKAAFKPAKGGQSDSKWATSAKLRAELAHEKPGGPMKSMDKVGKVPKAFKEAVTPKQVVAALLDD